jgi:uncharacterized membrane protein
MSTRPILTFLSLAIAGYALIAYTLVPVGSLVHPDMRAGFEANALPITVHALAAAFALALGPFQFSTNLRVTRPSLHRLLGRLYLGVGVLVGGLSGLYLSFYAFGGPVAQAGFGCLAIAWLYTGARAFLAIRVRDVAAHRRWMTRNFALAFAAVTLRLWLPAAMIAGLPFAAAYAAIAWLCWVPNLAIAEKLLRKQAGTPHP